MLPKIQIMFAAHEQPRFSEFYADLWRLWLAIGGPSQPLPQWRVGVDICYSLNWAIRQMPDDVEAVWIIGDDHRFDPDVIERLWNRNVPVVAPFCLRRNAPHKTVALNEKLEVLAPTQFQSGLWQVPYVGSAGLLVRRFVLDRLGDPWFRVPPAEGQERQSEDLEFCRRIGELGIPIYVDLDTPIGHITKVEVWPKKHETAGWAVQYRVNLQQQILP